MKRVVLVRTEGPVNAGLVARAVANFGPAELVFVAPAHPDLLEHDDFRRFSHGVTTRRHRVVDDLATALDGCAAAFGFTARFRQHREVHSYPERVEEIRAIANDAGRRVALVFGAESNGLTAAETAPLQDLLWIPTSTEHTSLNLANAVGVVLASLFAGGRARTVSKKGRPLAAPARRFLVEHLKAGLCERLSGKGARTDLSASIERIFERAALEGRDARAWHKLLHVLGSRRRPSELGLPEP